MRKIIYIAFTALLFVSCSNSDQPSAGCKLTSVKTETLSYDDIKVGGYNENFSGKLHFEYDNLNRISIVHGGLKYIGGLQSGEWTPYDDVTDVVYYVGNIIKVVCSGNEQARPYDKEFKISNGRMVMRKVTTYGTPFSGETLFTYEYNANEITEKIDGVVFRTFYLENGNLVKVELLRHSTLNGTITSKEEYLFSDYDSSPNLLKGKFYINGAFFKAFSDNNFKTVQHNKYYANSSGVLVEQSTYSSTLVIHYDAQQSADLFERYCN